MKCLDTCRKLKTACPIEDCRHWVDYEDELNCVLESVDQNGSMTLREVGDRLNISYVRVKQIQDKILIKINDMF